MNESGILPVNCNVLVKPDEVAEKIGSIYISDDTRDRDKHAQTQGTIVALCADAFHEMSSRPVAGQRVCFARYSGAMVKGNDGADYRLLKDIDVTGLVA